MADNWNIDDGCMPVLARGVSFRVPLTFLDEQTANRLHGQTLKGLASRGGLCWGELLANIERVQRYEDRSAKTEADAEAKVRQLVTTPTSREQEK